MRSTVKSQKWIVALVAILIAPAGVWVFLTAATDVALEENAALERFGESALQFGFNRYHSGVIEAPLSAESYSEKSVIYPARGAGSTRVTPIYVNGKEISVSPFEDKQILIFSRGRRLTAWDLIDNEVIWETPGLPGGLTGMPLLDPESGRIYFVTTRWFRVGDPATPQGIFDIQHWAHSITLDGQDLHTVAVDIRRLLEHEHSEFADNRNSFVHCKTSVGVNTIVDTRYMFFGCSMFTDSSIGLGYGHMKGSRGILVRVYLDDENHVVETGLGGFTPSMPTKSPRSGYDGGIYNMGSGPVVLDDGSIIVSTGNGPFLPAERNYGCSILRLNGITLQPESKAEDGYEYYTHEDGVFDECHAANIDMSSSSPVVIEQHGRYYAAITGKDGHLKVFDPFNLPGQERALKNEFLLGGQAHGQPSIWRSRDGEIRVNVIGRKQAAPLVERELVLASEGTWKRLSNQYQPVACIGLLPSIGGDGRMPLDVYYSGPFRNDYVNQVALEHSRAADQYFPDDTMPYRYQFTGGWIDATPKAAGPPGYVSRPLNVYGAISHGHTLATGYFNATPESVPEELADHVEIKEGAGYIFVNESEGGCGSYHGDSYHRIYLLSRSPEYTPSALFGSFTINADYTISERWLRHTEENYDIQNMSPLVVKPFDDTETPLMLFVVYDTAAGTSASHLMIVNAETGETIDMIPFSGKSNTTIPIVVGNDILLSTLDNGLVFFADDAGLLPQSAMALFSKVPSRGRALLAR